MVTFNPLSFVWEGVENENKILNSGIYLKKNLIHWQCDNLQMMQYYFASISMIPLQTIHTCTTTYTLKNRYTY
jgi:hypothetical protein